MHGRATFLGTRQLRDQRASGRLCSQSGSHLPHSPSPSPSAILPATSSAPTPTLPHLLDTVLYGLLTQVLQRRRLLLGFQQLPRNVLQRRHQPFHLLLLQAQLSLQLVTTYLRLHTCCLRHVGGFTCFAGVVGGGCSSSLRGSAGSLQLLDMGGFGCHVSLEGVDFGG